MITKHPDHGKIQPAEIEIPHKCDDPNDLKSERWKLIAATMFCFVFMIIELISGKISKSLAIITDALHLLSDISGFMISIFALSLATRGPSEKLSFGYHRLEVLGALGSITIVWIMCIYLVLESIERIKNPTTLNAKIMLSVAIIGLIVNVIIGWILHGATEKNVKHHNHSLNVRAALIHAIGDMIQSLAVLIAAVIIWMDSSMVIFDPICTIIGTTLVLASTWTVLKDALMILMEGTPPHIDTNLLKIDLKEIQFVKNIHDLHVWTLGSTKISATIHIEIYDTIPLENFHKIYSTILEKCQESLCSRGINHMTVQIDPININSPHCQLTCSLENSQ